MKKLLSIIILLVIGFMTGMAVNVTWDWWSRIDTDEIKLFLRYANNFKYTDGSTYKGATDKDTERIVDEATPIPFNISINPKNEQSVVLGLFNFNSKPTDDIMFRLILPDEFQVTRYEGWTYNGNGEYYTKLGNINSGVGHNTIKPIDFIVKEPNKYPIEYKVSGRGFRAFSRTIYFDVQDYSKKN